MEELGNPKPESRNPKEILRPTAESSKRLNGTNDLEQAKELQ
jgi:hypothetical protein